MREIEFRWKDYFGNWHYGLLPYMNIIKEFTNHEWVDNEDNSLVKNYQTTENIKIESETLGQYTGLKDKNGTKIFEGDIVKLEKGFFGSTYNYVLIEENENYAVYYDKYGRFDLKTEDKNLQFKSVAWHQLVEGNVEVIGNIYDNPELLEVEDVKD